MRNVEELVAGFLPRELLSRWFLNTVCLAASAASLLRCSSAVAAQRSLIPPAPAFCAAPDSLGMVATFLDVGQGDAALLVSGGRRQVLIDGGSDPLLLRKLLAQLQISALDLIIASHNHHDHVGGLPGVVRGIRVDNYLDNGLPATIPSYLRLLAALEFRHVRVLQPVARVLMLGELEVRVLPPWPGAREQNRASVGAVASYGAFRILFTGDADSVAIGRWIREQNMPRVSIVKVPHHGSSTGISEALVRATLPPIAVVSVGRNNRYGHPDARVLRLWSGPNRQIFRTDERGTIAIRGCQDGTYHVTSSTTSGTIPQTRASGLLPDPHAASAEGARRPVVDVAIPRTGHDGRSSSPGRLR